MLDTSLRPICFNIHNKITETVAKNVGPEKFKRYEYMLYFMAQITRFVHEDTGFSWYTMTKCLGLSNDIVNEVLKRYDTDFRHLRITPAALGDGTDRPMKSYTTQQTPKSIEKSWGTFISTHDDMTALILSVKSMPLKSNKNSILNDRDIIVAFKSTSTIVNLLIDFKSQFRSLDLQKGIQETGIRISSDKENRVPKSFLKLLMSGWTALMKSLEFHTDGATNMRLFITGHSLGAALATIFGLIMAEAKESKTLPLMSHFKSIHVIAFGAPAVCYSDTRLLFNKHLDTGLMTYDRVVSQTTPSLTTTLLSYYDNNNFVPALPLGYLHPGYDSSPFSMDNIRAFYGVDSDTHFRQKSTWAFTADPSLYSNEKKLDSVVKKLMIGAGNSNSTIHISNFISVAPLPHIIHVHGETLGVINKYAKRAYGMKNPVRPYSNKIAYFSFCPTGVKIEYLEPDGSLTVHENTIEHKTRKTSKKLKSPSRKKITLRKSKSSKSRSNQSILLAMRRLQIQASSKLLS